MMTDEFIHNINILLYTYLYIVAVMFCNLIYINTRTLLVNQSLIMVNLKNEDLLCFF